MPGRLLTHGAFPHFTAPSDRSLVIYLGQDIGLETHRRVLRLLRQLEAEPLEHVVNLHPAYTSLLVVFDPVRTSHARLETALRQSLERCEAVELPPPRVVEIPVRYGGEDGPDLDDVARLHGIAPGRVIELHASALYTVYFLGFAPGFAYLGGLPEALHTPRLATPRRLVPAGSVGIAGAQTGVYPVATPGGWRLIGRTPVEMFRAQPDAWSLLRTGDQVRFIPIPGEGSGS